MPNTQIQIFLLILCGCLALSFPGKAAAQTFDPVLLEAPRGLGDIRNLKREPDYLILKTVEERLHPDFRPAPVRWRGFTLYPLLVVEQSYNDNIFATQTGTQSDFVTTVAPSLLVQKEFGRHNASVLIEGDINRHWSEKDENTENFRTRFNALIEMLHDIVIPVELSYSTGHEKREQNFSSNFATEPIGFRTFAGALGLSYNPNRLSLSLVGRYADTAFEDGQNAAGQAVIRSDSDRRTTELETRASYDILPNHKPFLSFILGTTDYKNRDFQNGSFSGLSRDSTHVSVLAGWELAYKGLIEGYLGGGYTMRDYDDSTIKDIDSAKVAGSLAWNITKLATLNLGLRHQISEDSTVSQGIVLTQGRIGLDYEVLRNLAVQAYIDRALAEYEESVREDKLLSTGVGLRYVLSPRLSLSADYNFKARESSQPGLDYDRNLFMVRLNARL